MEIVFSLPNSDSPGYLRRQRQALVLQNEIKDDQSPKALDKMVEFLLPFVIEPAERDQAREALWDMPQKKFLEAINAIIGSQTPPKS